jgi:hypothetical protein
MKKTLILLISVIILHTSSYAGFLSGNVSPFVPHAGQYAIDISTSIVMVATPFSIVCISGRYAVDDNLSLLAKEGFGTIDYSTIPSTKLTKDPIVTTYGIEYVLGGAKTADYTSFLCEYETASWDINRLSNVSNEILLGMDFGYKTSEALRTRYRLALHNFNAGLESQEKIASSVKYSISTQLNYNFSKEYCGIFEAGVYLGDKVGGLLAYFGIGLGFNS